MDIMFYRMTDDKRKITKSLRNAITLHGSISNDFSIVNPEIHVGYNANIANCNYLYIPAFSRYYFINDIKVINHIMVISAHCDVLMSFRNEILSSVGTFTRSNRENKALTDSLVIKTSASDVQYRRLGNAIPTGGSYIIGCGG